MKYLFFLVATLLFFHSHLMAQYSPCQCNDVLNDSFKDYYSINEDFSLDEFLIKYFEYDQEAFSNYISSEKPSFAGAYKDFSASYDNEKYRNFAQQNSISVRQGSFGSLNLSAKRQILKTGFNKRLYDAYETCVLSCQSTTGISARFDKTDWQVGEIGILVIRYIAKRGKKEIKNIIFDEKILSLVEPIYLKKGEKIKDFASLSQGFRRKKCQATTVTITFKDDKTLQVPVSGSCKITPPPPPKELPSLRLKVFHTESETKNHPEASLTVPNGYKIISGGAKVNWSGAGNLLTSSYPSNDAKTWYASSKDHSFGSPANIEIWVIAVFDPDNEWDIRITSNTGRGGNNPSAEAEVESGYMMTGGGARANNGRNTPGQLLTASYPETGSKWRVIAKDHLVPYHTNVSAFAIGIKPVNGSPFKLNNKLFSGKSANKVSHPESSKSVESDYLLIGGGARVNWSGSGNLLTSSFSSDGKSWNGSGKDHGAVSPADIDVYSIGVKKRKDRYYLK